MVLATYLMQKKMRKNLKHGIFDKKTVFDVTNFIQYFHKILNISENTEPISTNLVLNESL